MAFGRVAKQKAVVEPHLVGGALGTLLRSAAAGEGGEAAAVRTVLSSWMQQQSADEEHFASKAVFVEVRLRQALSASASLGKVPNIFRTALVCDAFERVAPLSGRLEPLLGLLWRELLRCVFVDDSNADGDGDDATTTTPARGGARGYANRTPYFAEVRRVESELAELRATMANWEAQRTAAIAEIEERNRSVNHTLSAWNRALVHAGAEGKQQELQAHIGELARQLDSANDEISRLSDQTLNEPLARLLDGFDKLTESQQQSALRTILELDAAPLFFDSLMSDEGRRTSFRGAARLALGAVRASNRAAKYIDAEPSGSSRREEGEHAL